MKLPLPRVILRNNRDAPHTDWRSGTPSRSGVALHEPYADKEGQPAEEEASATVESCDIPPFGFDQVGQFHSQG